MDDFNRFVYEVGGLEFWFAKDLQNLLGYSKWENFLNAIEKAKTACENTGLEVSDNFASTVRVVNMPNGGIKETEDMFLTRYACYLVAQNSDPTKEQVAFAMSYFAIQTRKQELLEQRLFELERLNAREKLSNSEKELSGVIYERGFDSAGFATIKSKGDRALFGGMNTNEMKERLGVPKSRPLADFLPTITIKAKDFANEITIFNLKKEGAIRSVYGVSNEHEKNNRDVRALLIKKGITPENLPAEEDVQKLKRKIQGEDKKMIKKAKQTVNKK